MPAVYLFDRAATWLRVIMAAAVVVWFVVGGSPYGIFGPTNAALWYVPTSDGPCPIGGYAGFYMRAHRGDYQRKQVEHIEQTRDFVEFAKKSDGRYWIAGHWPAGSYPLVRALDGLGSPDQYERVERIAYAPGSLGGEQPNDGSRILMFRSGYLDSSTLSPDLAKTFNAWLEKGQLRPVGRSANKPLPTLIEIGDHIREGENSVLGQRLLFAGRDLYQGHMAFVQREFISPYRATSWISSTAKTDAQPIYRDELVAVYDRPIENATIFSYAWPARYYQIKSPIPKYRGHLAK